MFRKCLVSLSFFVLPVFAQTPEVLPGCEVFFKRGLRRADHDGAHEVIRHWRDTLYPFVLRGQSLGVGKSLPGEFFGIPKRRRQVDLSASEESKGRLNFLLSESHSDKRDFFVYTADVSRTSLARSDPTILGRDWLKAALLTTAVWYLPWKLLGPSGGLDPATVEAIGALPLVAQLLWAGNLFGWQEYDQEILPESADADFLQLMQATGEDSFLHFGFNSDVSEQRQNSFPPIQIFRLNSQNKVELDVQAYGDCLFHMFGGNGRRCLVVDEIKAAFQLYADTHRIRGATLDILAVPLNRQKMRLTAIYSRPKQLDE